MIIVNVIILCYHFHEDLDGFNQLGIQKTAHCYQINWKVWFLLLLLSKFSSVVMKLIKINAVIQFRSDYGVIQIHLITWVHYFNWKQNISVYQFFINTLQFLTRRWKLVYIISWLMLSVYLCPKVITLSGIYSIMIIW